ncbi:glycosyltransferase [Candidatus Peregrinibacteria bacterium]|jgi:glycosyltransferase involved in cell wall biosynthesis|nr:glycosyltransferase [Candidatus Peregrinibacteria bacterium]
MKIAIVHDFLVRFGGAEKLVQTWMEEFPEAPIFTLFYDEKKMGSMFPRKRVKTSSLQKYYSLTKRYTWLLPFMPIAIESFDLSDYDIILSSSAAFSHGVLTTPDQKHICYIHSPMRWAWDYHFSFIKERKMGFLKKFFFQKAISKIRVWDEISASRPDILLAASTEVSHRIKKYWRRDSEIIFPFVDISKFKVEKLEGHQGEKLDEGYFLIVSQLVPYKRIDIAIQACEELGLTLKIVGEGIMRKELEKISGPHIKFLGRLEEEDLIPVIQNAKAFLFPGIDDFGMAPIESMACGVPVLAYKKGGAMDTVKEGISGVFFKEQSVESLKELLKKTDFSQFDVKKIRSHAEAFSKERHMNKISSIYSSKAP